MNTLFSRLLLLSSFALILMSQKCDPDGTSNNNQPNLESAASDAEISPIIFTFNGDYGDLWEKVDSLQNEGLYESALEQVQVIYDAADKNHNAPQLIKASIHKIKFNSFMQEEDLVRSIGDMGELAENQTFPVKQIAHSIAAELYWSYYENNRWKFYNRTQTVNFDNKDIRTWDLKTIFSTVQYHYEASLGNADSLKHTAINQFVDILSPTDYVLEQRPTLFDFLAHRALGFFENTEVGLTRPAYKFTVEGALYFADIDEFVTINPASKDSLSNEIKAVQILKDLASFHLRDKNPVALIDIDLHRLKFARQHATDQNKDELYYEALQKLHKTYVNDPYVGEIFYLEASYLMNLPYNSNEPEKNKWTIKEARDLCLKALTKNLDPIGKQQCESLKKQIENKELSFQIEQSYSPETNNKFLFTYKNIDSVHFKIVKVNWNYFFKSELYGEDLVKDLLKYSTVTEWSEKVQNPGDFRSHQTEFRLPNLELGQYVILSSPSKLFSLHKNAIAYKPFWVTNLSYAHRTDNEDGHSDVFVTNRETGDPIKDVKATIYEQKYDYVLRKYQLKKIGSYRTDEYGSFTIPAESDYRYLYIDLDHGDDHYNNENQLYQYKPYRQNKVKYTTHFFTDRKIYRPGQTVYFKGIRIKHEGDNHTLAKDSKANVQFYDANYQKVSDLNLTSNEFGTFSGSFVTPQGSLNGQMRIQDEYGNTYFSVEEYKRPKFEVNMDPVEGVFRIGDEIEVTGEAKAFAGNMIDGANVSYSITRYASFHGWVWYRWGFYPYSSEVQISNGDLLTDDEGKFSIKFNAAEDRSVNKKYMPNYHYTVKVDVTDINGETHSSSQYVTVGYNAMTLSINLPGSIEKSEKHKYSISTNNLNGQKVNAKGDLKITKLNEPNRIVRSSFWSRPDLPTIDQKSFLDLFPVDVYKDENDIRKLTKGEIVFNGTFNSKIEDSIEFSNLKDWAPGRYVLEASCIDSFGLKVEDVRYITIIDKKSNANPTNELWKCDPLITYCEPGDTAEILISSGDKDLKVLFELEHKGKIVKKELITLSKSQKTIQIPVLEEHRGNFTIHLNSVKYGRRFSEQFTVAVPYSNKQLDVSFETFRNKLLPGQDEEWKIRIRGPKGEKVAAEMLATMYDASLDEFAPNSFYLNVFNSYYSNKYWNSPCFIGVGSSLYQNHWNEYAYAPNRTYPELNWWGYYRYRNYYQGYYDDIYDYDYSEDEGIAMDMAPALEEVTISGEQLASMPMRKAEATMSTVSGMVAGNGDLNQMEYKEKDKNDASGGDFGRLAGDTRNANGKLSAIQARKNMAETAFFLPHLQTDEHGDILIKFTIPEALTKWKFIGLAHTQDLKTGFIQEEAVTQKKLMVQPNAPRFLREGDKLTFTAKVSNLTEEELSGTAKLMLFDATTMEPLDMEFNNLDSEIDFTAKKGQSARLAWKIDVPFGVGAVTYRVVAAAKNHTDGEEMSLPVLSNRMLVTESLPLPSRGIGTSKFTFDKLLNSGSSKTLKHHKLTLEYTSNPAWYAIQAMPYMMEYPYECAEQTFTRFYTNSIASNIVNSSPRIKEVFESWKTSSPDAFLSNLEKNQELKSVMLEETPWVLDAKNENERKKRVGLLFDLNRMDNELKSALRKLEKAQVSNGGWPWFPGMPESRYITQHIVTGMGHLDKLGVKQVKDDFSVWRMVKKGIKYLDDRTIEDFKYVKRHYPNYKNEKHISELQIQYLYARSYFKSLYVDNDLQEAMDYYFEQAKTYWKDFSIYSQGMMALAFYRFDDQVLPKKILASLKERAIEHEELGMYWKDNVAGYYWYQAPIETQALLIEAFDEITDDERVVEDLKVWLLKQKQTTDWKTTKATAEACYALLLRGTAILENDEVPEIRVNNVLIDPVARGAKVEAGTGYFKTSWEPEDIKPEMGNVTVTRKTEGVSWGAMYWQYWEDLDKITTHETPLSLKKKLFLVQKTDAGEVITPITDETDLKPGSKIRVRIELRSDRNMEYVHMKDMRASGFEPINVFSRYKWQGGLGYYESTKDASTNFFMDYLPKGTYVFEYDLLVSHYGDFSNGITTIQCMYAPEFTSHSEGIRVNVRE